MKYLSAIIFKSLTLILILGLTSAFALPNNKKAAEKQVDPKKLEGYKVKFDYEGHSKERKIIYKYYKAKEDNTDPPLYKNQIGIDLYDIDNDGKKEILVYLHNVGYCGSAGCRFEIFILKDKNQYKPIILNVNVYEEIKILKSSHLGYQDILFNGKRIWC